MIPLYTPPSNAPIKWRSLVQLITPSTSRRGSIELLALDLDQREQRRRRPSAPAVLQDLRRILPAYILRRHYSASVLVNDDSTESGGTANNSTVHANNDSRFWADTRQKYSKPVAATVAVSGRTRTLSSEDLCLVPVGVAVTAAGAAPPPPAHTRNEPLSGAKFKCKRVKAARKPSEAPQTLPQPDPVTQQSTQPNTRRFAHIFKSKPKQSQSQPRARVRSISAAGLFGRLTGQQQQEEQQLEQQKPWAILLADNNNINQSNSRGASDAEVILRRFASGASPPPPAHVRLCAPTAPQPAAPSDEPLQQQQQKRQQYYATTTTTTTSAYGSRISAEPNYQDCDKHAIGYAIRLQSGQSVPAEKRFLRVCTVGTSTSEYGYHTQSTQTEPPTILLEPTSNLPETTTETGTRTTTRRKAKSGRGTSESAETVPERGTSGKTKGGDHPATATAVPTTTETISAQPTSTVPTTTTETTSAAKAATGPQAVTTITTHSKSDKNNSSNNKNSDCNIFGAGPKQQVEASQQKPQHQQAQQGQQQQEKRVSVAPSDSVSCGCARFLNHNTNNSANKNSKNNNKVNNGEGGFLSRRRNSESNSSPRGSAAGEQSARLSSLRGVKSKGGSEKRRAAGVTASGGKASPSIFPRVRRTVASKALAAAFSGGEEEDEGDDEADDETGEDAAARKAVGAELYVRRHTIPNMTVAAYGMVICGTDNIHRRYRGRIEKVKFGIPISEAFAHDIPATLLVLLLKVNKEGPLKKDIWRAPGNQIQVRKLSAIMQQGRLVNISNISVYTAASVLKTLSAFQKFLSKLPGGIFGADNEKQLFNIVQQQQQISEEEQRKIFCRVICSLSQPSQHLLVLLFGTFRVISDSAETFGTRMNADAIGISVAPSLFHTCIHDQRAKLEDVMRFKMASQVITKIIHGFGCTNLFPRECYEFYARITGRTLRVDDQWNFTFQYPSRTCSQPSIPAASSETLRPSTSGGDTGAPGTSGRQRRRRSRIDDDGDDDEGTSEELLGEILEDEDVYGESLPELGHHGHYVVSAYGGVRAYRARMHSLDDAPLAPALFRSGAANERLSTSMGAVSGAGERPPHFRHTARGSIGATMSDDDDGSAARSGDAEALAQRLRRRYPADALESTRSLTYLEWVHEEQTKRMMSRSEWFLGGGGAPPLHASPQSATSSRWDMAAAGKTGCSASCKSVDFPVGRFSSPMHLTLPKQDEDLLTSSGDEEMSSVFVASSSSSMKCSPRPVSSGGDSAQIHSAPGTSRAGNESKMSTSEPPTSDDDVPQAQPQAGDVMAPKASRQPLKLLQMTEYDSGDMVAAPAPEATPSATAARTPRRFFGGSGSGNSGAASLETTPAATGAATVFQYHPPTTTGPSEGGIDEPVESETSSPPSSAGLQGSGGSVGSGASVTTTVHVAAAATGAITQQQQQLLQRRVSSSGIVRRRSWRTHYIRPNKSLEYDSGQTKVELPETSHSSPIARSARSMNASRQVSDEQPASGSGAMAAASRINDENNRAPRVSIIRQTSVSSSGGTVAGGKAKIQSRRSTNI